MKLYGKAPRPFPVYNDGDLPLKMRLHRGKTGATLMGCKRAEVRDA